MSRGVEALVNALGGVTVNVPKDRSIRMIANTSTSNPKSRSPTRLNGTKTLQLLRFRQDALGGYWSLALTDGRASHHGASSLTLPRYRVQYSDESSPHRYQSSVEEILVANKVAAQVLTDRILRCSWYRGDSVVPANLDASYWLSQSKRIQDLMSLSF
jgi:hypothetical protein